MPWRTGNVVLHTLFDANIPDSHYRVAASVRHLEAIVERRLGRENKYGLGRHVCAVLQPILCNDIWPIDIYIGSPWHLGLRHLTGYMTRPISINARSTNSAPY